MEFAEKVRGLMKSRGMSQSDLATALGTNQQQVSRWLEGNKPPKWLYLLRMARTLRVPADFLIDPEQDEPPRPDELPADERSILEVYRSLKRTGVIDKDRAISGLTMAVSLPPVGPPPVVRGSRGAVEGEEPKAPKRKAR